MIRLAVTDENGKMIEVLDVEQTESLIFALQEYAGNGDPFVDVLAAKLRYEFEKGREL